MVANRNPRTAQAVQYQTMARKPRSPQHRFNIRFLPWQIQPVAIAPVLPGETVTNLHIMAQIWSEPLFARLKNTGWWCEFVGYYVKLRDLTQVEATRESIANVLVNGVSDLNTVLPQAGSSDPLYQPGSTFGGADFLGSALTRIVEEYWRFEGEAAGDFTIGGMPIASYVPSDHRDFMDKLTLQSDYEDRRVDVADMSTDGVVSPDAISRAYQSWEALKATGGMNMDFESWMRTYGSQSTILAENDPNLWRPEEIGHFRQWTYPTNSVEPTTGIPAVAVGWRITERFDKRIFCHEPGFIVVVCCIRPKVYPGAPIGYAAQWMTSQMHWLPALLNDQIDISHRYHTAATGPLANVLNDGAEPPVGENYVWDIRDLLNYGETFRNYDADQPGDPFIPLPDATGQRRYADSSDLENIFVAEVGEEELDQDIKADGVISFTIQGRQAEQSPQITLGGTHLTVPAP